MILTNRSLFRGIEGYIECWNCGEHWDDIDQIEVLFDLVEDLQEQIKEIKNG